MDQSPNHKQVVAAERRIHSAVRAFAKEDRTQSWIHVCILVLCVGSSYATLFFVSDVLILFPVSILLSLLFVRFFVIYHDYAHKTILQKSLIAKVIFTFFGLYTLAPLGIWSRTHNHHHQHNSKLDESGIGSFPIITKIAYLNSSLAERCRYLATRHPVTIVLAYFFTFLFGMCLFNVLKKSRKHVDSLFALILHLGIGLALFLNGGSSLFVFSFFMPALISSCIGAYLFYVQHNYPGVIHQQNANWSYYKAAMGSSGYLKMNPVMEWFTANIGYHHIHHLNAAIPFYKLPLAYNSIPGLKIEKNTTLHPMDIMKCLGLKVWDEAANRMIGVREL